MLIIGLGNPGAKYEKTRHNIGWMQVDRFASLLGLSFSLDKKHKANIARGNYKGKTITIAKPLTYMNLSGESVVSIAHYYKYTNDDIIVVYDDKDFDIGVVKIKKDGSSAGHNGIKSIISSLSTEKFIRVRMGIGAKPKDYDMANYVLSDFSNQELKNLEENVFGKCNEAIESIIFDGLDKAMNTHNRKAEN
jgi:PTH1 family peptidyl-tRNA hydrolase